MIPLPTGGVQRERGGSGPYGQPPAGDDVHQERGEGLNSGGGGSRKTEPFREPDGASHTEGATSAAS